MHPNGIPDIRILAQAVVHKIALLYKLPWSEKGASSAKIKQNFAKT